MSYKRIILVLLSLTFNILHVSGARSNSLDSLLKVVKHEKNDTLLCQAYQSLGFLYEKINLDSAKLFYQKGIDHGEKSQYHTKIGDAYLNMSFYYYQVQNKEMALTSIEQAIEAYAAVDSLSELAAAYSNLGNFKMLFQDYINSIAAFKKAIEIAEKKNDYDKMAGCYSNCGLNYQYIGRYQSAMIEYIKSAELREKYNLPYLHMSYINIAITLSELERYNKARNYYFKGLTLCDSSKDQESMTNAFNGLANNYLKQTIYDSVYFFFQKSKALNNGEKEALHEQNMGSLRLAQNKIEQALSHFLSALDLTDTTVFSMHLGSLYKNLAQTYLEKSKIDENRNSALTLALTYGKKSALLAESLKLKPNLRSAYKVLSEITAELQLFENALLYTNKWIELSDSLDNVEQSNFIADLQTKYETEKKALEIEVLNQENELKAQALEKSTQITTAQRNIIIITIIGIVLLFSLIIILYQQSKKRKKTNKQLQSKNETIQKQNEEKELLLKEIHHRVKNNLQVISSLLELQAKKVNETESEVFKEGQSRVRAMALIHEELYQNKTLSKVDFNAYTKRLTDQIRSLFQEKSQVELLISGPKLQLDIDTAIPLGLMLNELITNSFKYGLENNGKLSIEFIENDLGKYSVKLSDTGVGLPEDFELNKVKSLGLRLVNRLSKQLYGSFAYNKDDLPTFTIEFLDTEQRKKVA